MKKLLSFDESRKRMFLALIEFSEFCKKHNLRYSLAFGTLIGAVRHKGFIPWDDDIDVWMPYPDYKKFFEIYEGDAYTAINIEKNKNYRFPFGRLLDNKTYRIGRNGKKLNGIFIDIYPICGLDNPKSINHIYDYMNIAWKRRKKLDKLVNILSIIHLESLPLLLRRNYIKGQVKQYEKYDYNKSEYVFQATIEKCLKKELFEEFIDVEFEGMKFKAFKGYDEILRSQYNDYMQLPPEDQRKPYHGSDYYFEE